ncbi:hypothetical protein VTN77DRAFT_6001 [Rasamsonia byssochlamydoides]|uniref:uncharacterized protein n=1 Tax=Rasamsonia byssochlamydoides TaxID=89139 RepID=UPI003744535B
MEKTISSLEGAIGIKPALIGPLEPRKPPPIELVAAGRKQNGKAPSAPTCSGWLLQSPAGAAHPTLVRDDSISKPISYRSKISDGDSAIYRLPVGNDEMRASWSWSSGWPVAEGADCGVIAIVECVAQNVFSAQRHGDDYYYSLPHPSCVLGGAVRLVSRVVVGPGRAAKTSLSPPPFPCPTVPRQPATGTQPSANQWPRLPAIGSLRSPARRSSPCYDSIFGP